jgi:hypothetical protein
MPSDEAVQSEIEALEAEREQLRAREGAEHDHSAALERDAVRLEAIRVELDRLWDYLRQRRALREAGQDPDTASERSADVVKDYEQ